MPKETENATKKAIDQKLLPLYKQAAITNTTSVLRLFLEANPNFAGPVNIPIISLSKEDFENVDNDHLQRLTLKMYCLEALSHPKVRDNAKRAALRAYANRISDIEIQIEISSSEDCSHGNANAHVEIILPERG